MNSKGPPEAVGYGNMFTLLSCIFHIINLQSLEDAQSGIRFGLNKVGLTKALA